jgi:PAS domain S-box-containing protein
MYVGANKLFLGDFSINSIDQLIGKTDSDLLDEKDVIDFQAYDNQIFKSGDFFENIEKEIQFINGNKKWLSISKYPHYRDGVIIGLVGCYRIVGNDEKSENNPFSDKKLLEVLMDNMPDSIYFKDNESRFVRINRAQANLIGVSSPEDAIGKTDFDFFNLEMAKESFSDEQNILFEGEPVQRLEYLGTSDGNFKWMNSLKIPIKDEKGNAIGTVGISRDVDEMVETEIKLKTERDVLQKLIDHIPSPVFFKNEKSVFTRVNKSLVQLMGAKSTDNLLGKTDYDFYSKEDADLFRADEEEIIKTGKPVVNKIEKTKWSDDLILWVSTTKIPIRDEESGKVIGIVGISHDMTEQIKNEKELEKAMQKIEEASKAKSNFLSNMSHEIRTPLNGIIGMYEILKMSDLTNEQLKLVGIIKQSGHNLLSIINDILDLSKLESGKMKVDESELNLHNIVDEVVCMMDYAVSENDNDLKVRIDSNIPEYLIGDSLKIKQVLLNLISNAAKFTQNGKIIVKLKYVGSSDSVHCIVFEVVDTGIGMSEEEINVIFDPFIQADASTTRKFGGTGLGLSISKELIRMMGGELKVNSTKGEGSTFYFELKLKKVNVNELNYI